MLRKSPLGPPQSTHETPAEQRTRYLPLVTLVLALLIGLNILARYEPYTFLRRDASFYATITRGLATDGSLEQRRWQPVSWYSGENPQYRDLDIAWSNIAVGKDGTWYPKHSFVMPLFATPFYWLFGTAGLLLFNTLCFFILLLSAWLIASLLAPPLVALGAVVLCATTPVMVEHTYHFSFDIFTAALVAAGVALMLRTRHRQWLVFAGAGFLLGVALWARPTLLPLVVPLAVALAWKRLRLKELLAMLGAASIPLAVAAISNTVLFGAPWITAYHRVLTVVNGVPEIQSHVECFTLPVADGLERLFLSRTDGWLHRAPVLFLAVIGLLSLLRRSKELAIGLLVAFLGYVLLFTTYEYNTTRFFFPWLGLLVLPLALLMEDVAGLLNSMWTWLGASRRRVGWAVASTTLLAGAAGGVVLFHQSSKGYVLSKHVDEARVTRNDIPCDYFNMKVGRWECSKLEDKKWEYSGLALGEDDCLFDGKKGPAIWFHPPRSKGTKRMLFPGVPGNGTLEIRYGLADTAVSERTCFIITWGNTEPQTLCADKKGKIEVVELSGTGDGPETTHLQVEIKSPPDQKRHLCFDGTFSP